MVSKGFRIRVGLLKEACRSVAKSRSWQLCVSSQTIYYIVKHIDLQFGMILQQTSLEFPILKCQLPILQFGMSPQFI